jgi:hypothetical protein
MGAVECSPQGWYDCAAAPLLRRLKAGKHRRKSGIRSTRLYMRPLVCCRFGYEGWVCTFNVDVMRMSCWGMCRSQSTKSPYGVLHHQMIDDSQLVFRPALSKDLCCALVRNPWNSQEAMTVQPATAPGALSNPTGSTIPKWPLTVSTQLTTDQRPVAVWPSPGPGLLPATMLTAGS